MAFPVGWRLLAHIQVDHTKVSGSGNLSNFPALIKDGNLPANVYSNIETDGKDLRFTTDLAGTTEVPFQIVSITPGSSLCEIWLKIPTLDFDDNTSIYVWGDNSSATAYAAGDTYGSQAVWSGFSYVDHFQGQSLDSTVNGINGSDTSVTYSTGNGLFSQGAGTSDSRIDLSNVLSLTGNFTLLAWVNPTSVAEIVSIIQKGQSGARYPQWSLQLTAARKILGAACGDVSDNNPSASVTGATTVPTGSWSRIGLVRDGSNIIAYMNGVADGSSAWSTAQGASTDHVEIASVDNSGTRYQKFIGKLDEMGVTSSALTPSWMATDFANQNDPATFWISLPITNIKSVAGVLHTSIKKISGVAIADVKKVAGLA